MTRPDYVGHCVHNNWRDKQSQTNSVNYGRRVNHTRVARYTYLKVLYILPSSIIRVLYIPTYYNYT